MTVLKTLLNMYFGEKHERESKQHIQRIAKQRARTHQITINMQIEFSFPDVVYR